MATTLTTNATLPKPIDESRLMEDFENLQSAHNTAMDNLEKNLAGAVTLDNLANVALAGNRVAFLNYATMMSITTISGCVQNLPFTLICLSGASAGLVDVGNFKLASALLFTADDAIQLIWNGGVYYELGRSVN